MPRIPLRIAVVTTIYRYLSHAQHMADRFLIGYPYAGQWHRPDMKVVSLYVDQKPEGDQSQERAKEFGADEVVDPGSNDPVAAIKELTHGRYADCTLDTSSNPDARANAIRSTKVWGTMCFVGEGGDVHIEVSPMLLRRQLTLIGSWTFSNIIQAECATFCVERKIDVDALFTHKWKLEQADAAYKLFDNQSDGKGVFLM